MRLVITATAIGRRDDAFIAEELELLEAELRYELGVILAETLEAVTVTVELELGEEAPV